MGHQRRFTSGRITCDDGVEPPLLGATYKICSSCEARTSSDVRHCPACGQDLSEIDALEGDPYVGLALADKYLIESLIGEGAMGRVYRAKQIPLGKPFAVKILAPHLMNDEASHARFANEAHNCASLNHPNCISVVDYGRSPEGITYIVMEFIAGQTLEAIIAKEHPLTRERVTDIVLQVLAALTEAHGLGILHRDLKPENILVQQLRTHGELAKVLDFGIAKLMDSNAGGPGLTSAGMVCGTPEYMSPEQARGQKLDARSDLYAVGAILYQMLAGRPPFESDSAVEILHKHLHEQPLAPSRLLGTQPDALETVCLQALAKDPAERYASAQEFRERIIAATSTAPAGSITCEDCGARIRADHRFCASCGAPVPTANRDDFASRVPRRRPSGGGSGLNIPSQTGEPTAEVVVRRFPLPLVDRDEAIARFEQLLQLREGREGELAPVRVRVITGPRGVGKTRLGDEVATLAERIGWSAFWVGADPSGARTPLWPIQCMAAQLLHLDPMRVTTQDLGRVANLMGLSFEGLPGLAELFELDGPAHELEFRVRRRECFASATQTLLDGGRGRPLLLVFDDIEAFDAPSREVVRRLAHACAATPVTLVCTSSEQDVTWLCTNVERLELLDARVVEHVARQVTSDRPTSNLPEALSRIAPATPLKLETHLRLLAAGVQAGREMSEAALLETRLDQVDSTCTTLLELAAVLGERFLEADLVDMFEQDPARQGGAQVPEGAVEQALSQLHVEGMLLIIGHAQRAFAHSMLLEAVYSRIGDQRRRALHALAARTSRLAQSSVTVRAVHLVRASSAEAPEAVLAAARRSERRFDDAAVADFAIAGLDMLSARKGDPALPLQAELALAASRAMRATEDAGHGAELLRGQLELAHAPETETVLRAELGLALARIEQFDEAIVSLKKALGSAIAAGDRSAMARVYRNLGRVYASKGDVERAITELREGLDMFTLGEGPRAQVDLDLWKYLRELSNAYRQAGNASEARQWCEHALLQAERRGDRLGMLRCHTSLAWILRDLKQLALAEQHVARALDEARYFGDRLTTAELLLERARARAARGRLVEARRCCEEALRLATSLGWTAGIRHAERAIGMLAQQDTREAGRARARS
jgi:eukaryotic-like serine/threonine-protein kinase